MTDISFDPWQTDRGRRLRRRRNARRVVAVLAAAVIVAVTIWYHFTRPVRCSAGVLRLDGECVGVSYEKAFAPVGQDVLEKVRNAIKAENDWVDSQGGRPVTVAFLGPLTDIDPDGLTGGRIVHEIEGAYIAQHRLNHGPLGTGQRRIKLTLANEGHGERHWKAAVDQLVAMTDDDAPLEAVIGLVLSQKETAQAALELSKKHVPVIGDIITADGLDATGAVVGRPLDYLARVAIPNDQQIHTIADHLAKYRKDLRTAVMLTDLNGSDMYNTSLRKDFEKYLGEYWARGGHADDPFIGAGDIQKDIPGAVRDFCGPNRADMVMFAGRANALNQFISDLRAYQTQQGQSCKVRPLTIVTGSDAAVFSDGKAEPADRSGHPDASRFTVLYVPLADPNVLKRTNPRPWSAFATEFTRRTPGDSPKTVFSASDLNDGWGIAAHDAMMTAGSAIRQADSDSAGAPPKREDIRVSLRQFQLGRQITGAVTLTNLDRNGNPKPTTPPVVLQIQR
ncbi:hypothetical protein GCM10023191_047000 [Actinoallomurus oryzae]|uniref:ABC-type branched-chain amino acid transport system, substrate-binding protein n=1 Tax=Actinoallomurus oryzae TaxID=502180 RepID=A0ABP8Q9Q8_9ACTN